MAKLPVGDTLAYSLRFGLRAVPAFFRLGWLPLLILLSGAGLVLYGATGSLAEMSVTAEADIDSAGEAWAFLKQSFVHPGLFFAGLLVTLIGAILFIPVQVALLRKAAGLTLPGGLLAIRFGGPEWRYIGATLLSIPIFMLVATVAALPAIVAIAASAGPAALSDMSSLEGEVPGGVVTFLAMLLGGVFLIWFTVRFSLFSAYAAVTNRIAPLSAFKITAWNFWRIVAVGIILGILMLLIEFAFTAFQVAFQALAGIAGSGIGMGEGSALAIGLAATAALLGAAQQIYGLLVSAGYTGRAVDVLSGGTDAA